MNIAHPEQLETWRVVSPIRVLVIDAHSLFRRGIAALMAEEAGLEFVGEAADIAAGEPLAAAAQPDVILLDMHLPGVQPSAAVTRLREAAPDARIVMLTASRDAEDLGDCLRAGAAAYLLKNIEGEFLIDALRQVSRGRQASDARKFMESLGAEPPAPAAAPGRPRLSPREREILTLVATGSSNKEVARQLGVAESTVKIHVQHILRKLGLSSRVQAAVYAAEHGMVLPPQA
jgi:two-component system nitrate/nitrite response regulator NarL